MKTAGMSAALLGCLTLLAPFAMAKGADPAVDVVGKASHGGVEIPIWPGVAPGSESWKSEEHGLDEPGQWNIWDVTQPSVTAYLPDPEQATGQGVLVCGGGGGVNISLAGPADMAAKLAKAGIAAFVLKYRTIPLGLTPAEFVSTQKIDPRTPPVPRGEHKQTFEEFMRDGDPPFMKRANVKPLVKADVIQAVRFIRSKATRYLVDPKQISVIGFSAGGTCVDALMRDLPQDFAPIPYAALVYTGGVGGFQPTSASPAVFLAAAANDRLGTADAEIEVYRLWRKAGNLAELHVYANGDHGFIERPSTSAGLLEDYLRWLRTMPMIQAAGKR